MEELAVGFDDKKELYRCYMPFLKNGGVFVRTARSYSMGQSLALTIRLPDETEPVLVSGKISWLAEKGSPGRYPAGIGVAFIDDKAHLNDKIKHLLADMLNAAEPTYTM